MYRVGAFTVAVIFLLADLSIAQEPAAAAMPRYDIRSEIDPDQHTISSVATVTVDKSQIAGDTLSFFLSSEADISAIEGEFLESSESGAPNRGVKLHTLRFREDYGSEVSFRVTYSLAVPENHRINRITDAWIELNIDSMWHPVLSTFPRFHYRLELLLDREYSVLTGDHLQKADNGAVRVIESRIPRIDIPFSAARQFYSREGRYSRIYSTDPETDLDSLLIYSERTLEFLKGYIDEPADFRHRRTVVVSPREKVGYSRKNYIVLSDLSSYQPVGLSGFLAHEFAHYWFSEANPSSRHHWLSESFAEFLSMIYVRETHGKEAFDEEVAEKKQSIEGDTKPLSAYTSRPSYKAMYVKGPLVLNEFESYIGRENFRRLMNRFVDLNITTNEALFAEIESLFGTEASQKLRELRGSY